MTTDMARDRSGLSRFAAECGLAAAPGLAKDAGWWLAALAAVPVCLVLSGASPGVRLEPAVLLSVVLWQPLTEELLFRGVLQGQLRKPQWGRRSWFGISGANFAASLVFAALHLLAHPAGWAAAVLVPSLVFGHFRDRYASVLPAVLLHAWYNAGYFLL